MNNKILILLTSLLIFTFISCEEDPIPQENKIDNLTANYRNDVVWEWSEFYLEIEKDLDGFRPCATTRALAYIHLASYETALPGMPNFFSNERKLKELVIPDIPVKDLNKFDWNIAINACMATTFNHFLINKTQEQTSKILQKESAIHEKLKIGISEEIVNNSKAWGINVANAVIAYADTDLEAVSQIKQPLPDDYIAPVGDGKWVSERPDGKALYPYWGKVRTFANFGDDLIADEPPTNSINPESQYYLDFKEVYLVSKNRTEEQRWISEFWSDDIPHFTFSPPARVFAIANQLIKKANTNLETTLHLFLKLGFSENDGAVAAWNSKYIYNVERPSSFIRKNFDPNFQPLLGVAYGVAPFTPPFPGYPSGHSTFGGLGSEIFATFFGESFYFTDRCHANRTDEFYGTPRSFSTMKEFGEENAYSRIWLGVHPRFDCQEGLRLGRAVAKNVLEYKVTKI